MADVLPDPPHPITSASRLTKVVPIVKPSPPNVVQTSRGRKIICPA